MHLAYDLLEEWDALVLVDAVPSRGDPGTLHVFEADHEAGSDTAGLDAHSMDPAAVFASLRALGGSPPYTVVVGCEAGNVEEGIGLTEPVARAVPRAARAVEEIVAALQHRSDPSPRHGRSAEPCAWEFPVKWSGCWTATRDSSRWSTSPASSARSTSACCRRRPSRPATG